MTQEQLRRVDIVNSYAAVYKIVMPIDYGRFAILDERERELCLQSAEGLIKKDKNRTRTDIAQLTESYIKLKISLFGEWRCIC